LTLTRTQRQIEEYRKGDACLVVQDAAGRPCAGVAVSVEQESHFFAFASVVPDLSALSQADRGRYCERLAEVFNLRVPGEHAAEPGGAVRVEVAEPVHLGLLRLRLDELGQKSQALHVHLWGSAVGLCQDRPSSDPAERDAGSLLAELYTLCFAHPAVAAIVWNGLADGDPGCHGGGLLRRDLAPRYAFKVLQKLIGVVWHSRATGTTDADGIWRFRGFFGDYRVVAGVGDAEPAVSTIALQRGGAGVFSIGAGRT
jgi:hypothetical protein